MWHACKNRNSLRNYQKLAFFRVTFFARVPDFAFFVLEAWLKSERNDSHVMKHFSKIDGDWTSSVDFRVENP